MIGDTDQFVNRQHGGQQAPRVNGSARGQSSERHDRSRRPQPVTDDTLRPRRKIGTDCRDVKPPVAFECQWKGQSMKQSGCRVAEELTLQQPRRVGATSLPNIREIQVTRTHAPVWPLQIGRVQPSLTDSHSPSGTDCEGRSRQLFWQRNTTWHPEIMTFWARLTRCYSTAPAPAPAPTRRSCAQKPA